MIQSSTWSPVHKYVLLYIHFEFDVRMNILHMFEINMIRPDGDVVDMPLKNDKAAAEYSPVSPWSLFSEEFTR